MSCDYCFVVYNLTPGQRITSRGSTFPASSFFYQPFNSTFTFGEKQLSDDHVHVSMPTKISSSFSGTHGDFLVNSHRNFLIFTPIKKTPLTYEEVLLPSDETHEVTAAVAPSHHRIGPGSVIVGVDTGRQGDMFSCFVYFLNGAKKHAEIPASEHIYNTPRVISHFLKMEPDLKKKLESPWLKIAFKGSVLMYGERFKGIMPPKSHALMLKEGVVKEEKRAAEQDAGGAASKRGKTSEK